MRPQPLFPVGDPILEGPAPADLATAMATPGLDAFLAKYPVDERAYDFFACSSQQVQEKVLREFRPKAEGEASYAGLFTSFVRKVRQLYDQGGPMPGVGGKGGMLGGRAPAQQVVTRADAGFRPMVTPNMAWAFEEVDPLAAPPDLESFRARYPMDDRALDFLQNVDVRARASAPPAPDSL
ncbi:unnamed protein product [Prorocentrum cordatum]|uniref:Uncharacterized protein n=1 Tax=Prorocentrum cordatum TaxID=2364126 RepID=A0ABN9V7L8_9DINO|nr:unnamed protein product [Polarella glacialis]